MLGLKAADFRLPGRAIQLAKLTGAIFASLCSEEWCGRLALVQCGAGLLF